MKKLLKGFTLAEVLITLTIVGVVARVTLPALMQNVQLQSTAASLSKAINTLETGNQRILGETGSRSLSGAGLVSANNEEHEDELSVAQYLTLMNTYMNGSVRTGTFTINGVSRANQTVFITKDGIMFTSATSIGGLSEPLNRVVGNRPNLLNRRIPQKYHGSYAKLLVDVNGVSGPNELAKDQFIFYIDNYGAAVPYGSMEYTSYALDNGARLVNLNGNIVQPTPLWSNLCAANQTPGTDAAKASCTGSIVDNNFKVVYAY